EKVEVISNPSAKYEAGTSTGILNIITKKNNRVGYFGMARLGIDRFGLPSGGGNLSIRKNKVNFNLVLFGMMRKMDIFGGTDRYSPYSILKQKEDGSNMRFNMLSVRPSFDFYITNRTTLSIGGGYTMRHFTQYVNQNIIQENFEQGINTSNIFQNRNGNTQGIINMPSANIGIVQLFPKEGEKLTATIRYNEGYVNRPTLLHQQQWEGLINQGEPDGEYYQQINSGGENRRLRMQIDYENPLSKNMELDAGFSGQYRYISQNYSVYQGYSLDNLHLPSNEIDSLRNVYINTEQTYGLYLNLKHQIKLPNADYFSYQVGLRGELFFYDAQVSDVNNLPLSYKNYYYKNPWDILFPSIFLSYKMPNTEQEFQFNYTRRVNRPFFRLTNPYINYLDSLNITQGNPDLKPAFSNYFELNYNQDIVDHRENKHNIFVALYTNYTTGMITNYQYQQTIDNNPLIITSYVNAGTSVVSGLEITPQLQIFKWFTFKPSFNLYYSNINTPSQEILNGKIEDSHSQQWSYYAKLSMDFSLPKELSIQLIGDYFSKRLSSPGNAQSGGMFNINVASSQGYIDPYWGFDIAIKKNFTRSKIAALKPFSITLNTSDIAGTRYFGTFSNVSGGIRQSAWRRFNPFYVSLNISFRFGKLDTNTQKKKNMKSDNNDSDEII
ncbi:MAG: outer membrane beta-barrel protein, partial [Chitinophagaceae bacterium]